ncbi:hypothetical protein BY458DRAFT_520980 [Sporodiniella umbellata]|nr:hypothetical protein BY458DRAFT_520980 [Sporodiniella umbellata]
MYASNTTPSNFPSFELTASNLSSSRQLSAQDMEHCLSNYSRQDSMDYSRRSSYFTGLLSSAESDQEQQTPSPLSVYEAYPHYSHPLDNDKRRMSTLVELPQMSFAPAEYVYSPANSQPWLADPVRSSMLSAMDLYASQAYLNQPNQYHPLADPMEGFRERASSACSSLSADSVLSLSPPVRATKAPVKRSRGRRVSNSPSSMPGQKMFTCTQEECGKVFKRSEHLKRHIRSIHTMEKPYECPYHTCSKRFSRSDNLNQHIRIHRHTGKDKPHPRNSNSFDTFMPAY